MAQIIWTSGALQDLDEIARYIAERNPASAERLVRRLFERVALLETSPEIGHYVRELHDRRHRELVVSPCRVIYQYVRGTVVIELVIRGERLLREELIQKRRT